MARRHPTLNAYDALRRTDNIVNLLAEDTWFALRTRATLHTANQVVCQSGHDHPSRFGDTYNVIQNSLALNVALALARLFDVSTPKQHGPIETQDKASIPVLAHLLMRTDVRDALEERARGWHPQLAGGVALGEASCRKALDAALASFTALQVSAEHKQAYSRIREFRTRRLAHNLFDKAPTELPLFDDLDVLADNARTFVCSAMLAINGYNRDLREQEERKEKMDTEFWTIALSATFAAEQIA